MSRCTGSFVFIRQCDFNVFISVSMWLVNHYDGAYQPGEQVSELDLQKWAEWDDSFFDLELSLQEKGTAKQAVASGKRKPRRKVKATVSVKRVRASAF